MGCITANSDTTNLLLKISFRSKHLLLAFHNSEDTVIITRDTTEIHRNHRLGFRSDSLLQSLIIHFKTILLYIYEDDSCSHVLHYRSTRCISISRNDNFIPLAYAEQSESHLSTSSLRVKTYSLLYTDKLSHFLFQFLSTRTRSNPSTQNGITNLTSLCLRHIRWRERHISSFQICTHNI